MSSVSDFIFSLIKKTTTKQKATVFPPTKLLNCFVSKVKTLSNYRLEMYSVLVNAQAQLGPGHSCLRDPKPTSFLLFGIFALLPTCSISQYFIKKASVNGQADTNELRAPAKTQLWPQMQTVCRMSTTKPWKRQLMQTLTQLSFKIYIYSKFHLAQSSAFVKQLLLLLLLQHQTKNSPYFLTVKLLIRELRASRADYN